MSFVECFHFPLFITKLSALMCSIQYGKVTRAASVFQSNVDFAREKKDHKLLLSKIPGQLRKCNDESEECSKTQSQYI